MIDPAVDFSKAVCRSTNGSLEAAVLELERMGWDHAATVSVIEQVFSVTIAYTQHVVASSVAWE
ncbi:MAG: hypothetical protein EOO61_04665 [Hymenobacter sp.]|nr:MAG: hypothetical protein EOO61_04665 [Hymenobacter sp.]